jgi:hypothetical protein
MYGLVRFVMLAQTSGPYYFYNREKDLLRHYILGMGEGLN